MSPADTYNPIEMRKFLWFLATFVAMIIIAAMFGLYLKAQDEARHSICPLAYSELRLEQTFDELCVLEKGINIFLTSPSDDTVGIGNVQMSQRRYLESAIGATRIAITDETLLSLKDTLPSQEDLLLWKYVIRSVRSVDPTKLSELIMTSGNTTTVYSPNVAHGLSSVTFNCVNESFAEVLQCRIGSTTIQKRVGEETFERVLDEVGMPLTEWTEVQLSDLVAPRP